MTKAFLLAGEASGDRIGAALMWGLKQHGMGIDGVGGEAMTAAGLNSLFPMEDLAVMGYADVFKRLPLLLWRARQVVRHILRTKPDLVVLIDAQVFSKVIAGRLRKAGFTGKLVLYVAPTFWAWRPERAAKLAPLFDEVLCVLPFEPQAMKALNGPPARYVGHPALSRFRLREQLPARGPLLLLPGSRRGELRRHLPLMRAVGSALADHPAVSGILIPTLSGLHGFLTEEVARSWPIPAEVVSAEESRAQALSNAVAAFSVSGTATLELALAGIPHVITYIAEPGQVRMYEESSIVSIGLPNIIAGREIVPEALFGGRADPERAIALVKGLLDNVEARAEQLAAFAEMRALMEKGAPEAPLSDPVERLLALL